MAKESIESIDEKLERLEKRKTKLLKQKRKIENETNIKEFETEIANQNLEIVKILENAGYSQYISPQFQIDRYLNSRGRLSVPNIAEVSLRSKPENKAIFTEILPVSNNFKWSNNIVTQIETIMQVTITFKDLIDKSLYSPDTIRLKKDGLQIDVRFYEDGKINLYAFGNLLESSNQGMKVSLSKYSAVRITPCEAEAYFEYKRNNVDNSILIDEISNIIENFELMKTATELTDN